MSTHPYLPLYVDDYEAATAHLTAAEDGVYSRLLRLCWRTPGCSLPNDHAWIARKIRVSPKDFDTTARPVLEEFFKLSRGRLIQKRLKAEYDDISRKKSARAKAGKKGGDAKAQKLLTFDPSNATDLPAHTGAFPNPEPEPERKKEANASSAGSAEPMPTDRNPEEPSAAKADPWSKDRDFLAAWAACTDKGRTRSSRAKAWTAWRNALKRETGPALAAAMTRYVAEDEDAKRTGGPGFHTWLTDGRFEHWTGSTTTSGSPTAAWSGPPALRATIVTALGEEFAAKWIDPYCSWSPMDRTLLVANAYAAKQISQELGAGWFTRNNAHIAIAPANGNDAPLLAHGAAA